MVHDHSSHQGSNAGPEGVSGKHKAIVRTAIPKEAGQGFGFAVEQPDGRLEQAKVDVPSVEQLGPRRVIEEEAVVGVVSEVEAADGEDDLAGGAVDVDEVRRAAAAGISIGGALDDGVGVHAVTSGAVRGPAGAGKVVLVGGEDSTAGAGDGSELIRRGACPGGAIVGANARAAAAGPAGATEAEDALDGGGDDHGRRRP